MAEEIERQWVAERPITLPTTVGRFEADPPTRSTIVDRYLDTSGRRLAEVGVTLRIREVDGQRLATFKRPLGADMHTGMRHREEIEGPVGDDPEAAEAFVAARDISRDELVLVGELRNERTTVVYRIDAHAVEVVVDELTYPDESVERRVEAEGPQISVELFGAALEQVLAGLRPAMTTKAEELRRRTL